MKGKYYEALLGVTLGLALTRLYLGHKHFSSFAHTSRANMHHEIRNALELIYHSAYFCPVAKQGACPMQTEPFQAALQRILGSLHFVDDIAAQAKFYSLAKLAK
jgi:hypothetical protein